MSEPVGIIYPPPDVRGVVDKTAKFVARNGRDFEEKVKQEHRKNPRFSFLLRDDPFHAYYEHKVNEIRESILAEAESKRSCEQESANRSHRDEDAQEKRSSQQNDKSDKVEHTEDDHAQDRPTHDGDERLQQDNEERGQNGETKNQDDDSRTDDNKDTPGVKSTLNDYIQEMTLKLEEPPHLNHLANPASFITHLESDTIKLTAQFIATYGRPFLLELVSREQGNPRFDFLRPQHGQFPYMTRLIIQYALIQNPPLDILDQLEKDSTSQQHILDRCKQRAEWNKMLEVEKKKREEAEEREKLLYSQIDWHDFVVVETIDYPYNEVGEYPPTTADQVGTRLLKQQRKEDLSAPEEMDVDMDVDSDNDDSARLDRDESSKAEFTAPYPPDDESRVVIRRDYDPKAATRVVTQPEATFVSPITNERIPAGQIHDHMRYNLSDPRHLELKEKSRQEKAREEAVFASGSQIQDNLKSLAERRTDVFGLNDEQAAVGQRIDDEKDGQTKDNKVQWDGHKSSIKRKKLN